MKKGTCPNCGSTVISEIAWQQAISSIESFTEDGEIEEYAGETKYVENFRYDDIEHPLQCQSCWTEFDKPVMKDV